MRGPKVQLECAKCGENFLRFRTWAERPGPKFCSRKCCDRGKKRRGTTMVPIVCRHCGQTRSFRKGNDKRDFCSRQCHSESRRGTAYLRKRDGEYRRWAIAVVNRDKRCLHCGSTTGELHAHHTKSYAGHPELRYEISNGKTLCAICHAAEHPGLEYLITAHRYPQFPKECAWCHVIFFSRTRESKYCSRRCMGSARKIRSSLPCAACGKYVSFKPSRKRGKYVFCSRACSTAWFGITQGGRRCQTLG